jgi:hypothetical protein
VKNVQINKIPFLIGLGVFIVCLVLRLVGITWGLPSENRYHSLHPDEEVILMYSQSIEPAKGKFTPGFYNYGTLYLTIQKVATSVVSGYGGGPQKEDGSDVPLAIGRYILAGRVISSLAGALAALAVFLTLLRHTNWLGSLLGAAAMGLTPAFVVHSRFQTVDVLATCFLTWCFYNCSRMFPQEGEEIDLKKLRQLTIWAGVFAGLSAGTKYTGILAFVAIGFALFFVLGKDRLGDIAKLKLIGFVAMIATFVLVTPGVVLDNAKFMQDFKYEMLHTSTGHGLVFAGTSSGWLYHISNLVIGYGGPLLIFSALGIGYAIYRKQTWLIGPIVFAVLIYILIGRAEVKFMRYVFPLLPVLAMGFGWIAGRAHEKGTTGSKGFVAFCIISLSGFGGGLVSSVNLTNWMVQPDVRDQMGDFVRANLPKGSSIGLVSDPWFYTPTLHPNIQAGPAQMRIDGRLEQLREIPDFKVIRHVPEDVNQRQNWDVNLLIEDKPDFVLFSSFETEGLVLLKLQKNPDPQFKVQLSQFSEFMDVLQRDYEMTGVKSPAGASIPLLGQDGLLFTGGIHDMAYIRPQLWLWIRKDLQTESSGTSTPLNSSEAPASTPSAPTPETSSAPPTSSTDADARPGNN